jgi:1-aminocyclopropane-1-carboxylate synthase 1/2/6
MVSERGATLAAETPQIAVAHFEAESDPYHPRRNPAGYVNLGTAENRLVWDLLAPALTAARPLVPSDTHYGPLYGTAPMREAVARFLAGMDGVRSEAGSGAAADAEPHGDAASGDADSAPEADPGGGADIDPEDVIVVSGATAALDIIASAICNPGDAIVVPAPYYGALDTDLCGRSEARIVPAPQSSDTGFRSMPESVERAIDKAGRDGMYVRAIALTSPYNPVGHVYTEAELRAVAELAEEHDLQLIVDEIYANSVFGTDPFVSMLSPPPSVRPERVHVVWGFAKDFGLPGLKVGVLHTRDPEVRAAARALAYFAPVSTDTQGLLCRMLDDADWVAAFLAENRKRLTASYVRATWMLKDHAIEAIPAGAGFSHWCDLRSWLTEPTFAAERVLWRDIFATERVNVLPGEVFASPEPGWFRVCHTANPEVLDEGVARLGRYWTRRVERRKAAETSSAATAAAG